MDYWSGELLLSNAWKIPFQTLEDFKPVYCRIAKQHKPRLCSAQFSGQCVMTPKQRCAEINMKTKYDPEKHKESLHNLNEINQSLAETAIAKSTAMAFLGHLPKWLEFVNWTLMASGAIIAVLIVNIQSITEVTGARGLYQSTLALGISIILGVLSKYQLMIIGSGIDSFESIEKEMFNILAKHNANSSTVNEGAEMLGENIQTDIDINRAMGKYLSMFPLPYRVITKLVLFFSKKDELMGYRFYLKWMCYILPLVGLQLMGLVAFIVIIGLSVWRSSQGII